MIRSEPILLLRAILYFSRVIRLRPMTEWINSIEEIYYKNVTELVRWIAGH